MFLTQLYIISIRVIILRYLYVINDPPCNSVNAAKRLNKRSLLLLLLLLLLYCFFFQHIQEKLLPNIYTVYLLLLLFCFAAVDL